MCRRVTQIGKFSALNNGEGCVVGRFPQSDRLAEAPYPRKSKQILTSRFAGPQTAKEENEYRMSETKTHMNEENSTQAAEEVWVTDIFWSPEVSYGFSCEAEEADIHEFIRLIRAAKEGEPLQAADLPPEMWKTVDKSKFRPFPPMFRVNGFDAITGEMAEVLRRHNIGDTKLFPVTLLKEDRKTPFEGEFFFLNIREKKLAFDPGSSRNFKQPRNPNKRKGSIPHVLADDDISVNPSALIGPDLWLDPSLLGSYFIKGALARELINRKMIPSNQVVDHADISRCVVTSTEPAQKEID